MLFVTNQKHKLYLFLTTLTHISETGCLSIYISAVTDIYNFIHKIIFNRNDLCVICANGKACSTHYYCLYYFLFVKKKKNPDGFYSKEDGEVVCFKKRDPFPSYHSNSCNESRSNTQATIIGTKVQRAPIDPDCVNFPVFSRKKSPFTANNGFLVGEILYSAQLGVPF